MFRYAILFAAFFLLNLVMPLPADAAPQCYVERSLSCSTTPKCRLGTVSQGCSSGVRRCCTVDTTSPPPVTTGGGTIGGGNPVCYIRGVPRRDIAARDCAEAQRTGCIRRLLTATAYQSCLNAQNPTYPVCIIRGVQRYDIHPNDCREAQRTGCIRRLLTPAAYRACLRAQ